MGRQEIVEKLSRKLLDEQISESDIVYILSRVRKILEINNFPAKYDRLRFYCNLALHSRIDRLPKSTRDMLLRIKAGGSNPDIYQDSILGFEDFHRQFKEFLKEYKLPDSLYANTHGLEKFNELLASIYTDTPIILTKEQKFEVLIDKQGGIRWKSI